MSTYISPGVYTVEQDLSAYISDLSSTIVGMVGTADSGPTNTPILITTASDFVSTFGNLNPQHYLGYAALAYLERGSMLWVTRVSSSDATYAANAMLLPANYTQYTGAWTLAGQTTSNVTFTLSNNVGAVGAANTMVLDSTTSLPGFDPTDHTNATASKSKMGCDLLSLVTAPAGAPAGWTSPALGAPLSITTGAGKNTTTTITAVSSVGTGTGARPQITVPLSSFVSNNSPATSFAVGSLSLATGVTLPTAGTALVVIGSYGTTTTYPIELISGASDNTLYAKALALYNGASSGTLAVADLESLFVVPSFTPPALPASIGITIPLYDISDITGVNTAKNMVIINSVLTTLLKLVNLSTAPSGTNSAVFYNNCRVLVPSTGLYGVGSISSLGTSCGFSSLATPTVDASGNILSVNLVSILPGLAGHFLYSAQTPATNSIVVTGDQVLQGTLALGLYRPSWTMVQAGSLYVPTILKFTSLGQADSSNLDITLSMNVTDKTADGTQNYTLRIYQRVSSTNVALTSQNISDFGLLESYYGSIEGIQSQLISSSRTVRLKIDYSTLDVINMTLGSATSHGDNLAFNPVLLLSETNSGVSVGTKYAAATTGYNKALTAPMLGGSIGSSVNAYDIIGDEVSTGLFSFANAETIDVNILLAPGWSADPAVAKAMISICETRGDAMAILDSPFGLTVQNVVAYRNNISNINSSYAAMYYPWVKIADPVNQKNIFVPPSGQVVAQYAYNDSVAAVHYAPAGINRGILTNALSTERLLSQGERDALSLANINPIHNEPGYGIYIRGQYTLQTANTALNRVNVRRMLLHLRKVVATASKVFEFEPADMTTALRLKQVADGLLQAQLYNGAIQSYTIDVGPDVNTPLVFDNNQLAMKVSLIPTKTAEVIVETFTILPQSGSVSVTTS